MHIPAPGFACGTAEVLAHPSRRSFAEAEKRESRFIWTKNKWDSVSRLLRNLARNVR